MIYKKQPTSGPDREFTIKDMVNDEEKLFLKNKWLIRGGWSYLFKDVLQGNRPKKNTPHLTAKIIRTLLELMFHDMLYNHTTAVLSAKPMLKFNIDYLKNFDSYWYRYNPVTGGRNYRVFVYLDTLIQEEIEGVYRNKGLRYIKLTLYALTNKGYHWDQ
jgi:hypothetical protein